MTLTYRRAKGSQLTSAEADANVDHLLLSSNHTFAQSGSTSISESVQSRERWWVYITDKMSDTDRTSLRAGTTVNIDTALTNALADLASGGTIFFPDGNYSLTASQTIPSKVRLQGQSRAKTKILRAFAGTQLMTWADSSSADNIWFDGDGANFAGKGAVIAGTAGKQSFTNTKWVNFDGNCIEFTATTAGSQFNASFLEAWQTNGATGNGKYAIVVADGVQAAAVPKSFVHVETAGLPSFDFGGSNDTFISNSFIADLKFSSNTRSIEIHGCRWANQTSCTIDGANHVIGASDVLPALTIASGASNITIGPCSLNTAPYVTDSSGVGSNKVFTIGQTFTPAWTAASVAPAIVDGTILGWYSRNGNVVTATISIVMGPNTTFGSGEYSFSLPIGTTVGSRNQIGSVHGLRSGVSYIAGSCVLASGGSTLKCYHQGGGTAFKETVPHTWAQNDTLTMTITYMV